jgi:hypothetical protein
LQTTKPLLEFNCNRGRISLRRWHGQMPITVTVDERGGLRLIDYLRWAELHIYMAVHELSLTCTRRSGQGPNRYNH